MYRSGTILDLLLDLGQELELSYIIISHDISVIRYMADRVAVMHRGRIVEIGETGSVCDDPQHPYTRSLISAIPKPDPRKLVALPAFAMGQTR